MRKIIKRMLFQFLKSGGFEAANKRAVELLIIIFEDRIRSLLFALRSKSLHAGRPTCSMIDIYTYIVQCIYLGCKYRNVSKLGQCKNKYENLFQCINIPNEIYENTIIQEQEKWVSPLSNRVEKFIHIYDFMPDFPPIHTFRLTPIKQLITKNLSSKVKNRLEQSLKSEKNMIKLIKSSGSLPRFINFLYKNY